jgi:transmembrane sensor
MKSRRQIDAMAAEWLVRRNRGLRPWEMAEYRDWLEASPAHAEAMRGLEAAWEAVCYPATDGRAKLASRRLAVLGRQRRSRRLRLWRAAAAATLVIVGWASLHWRSHRAGADSAIELWLPGHQTLSDGTQVELNRGAGIEVNFSAARRDVKLLSGQALFTVAKNPLRPFVVTAEGVEIRAVGTAFAVNCAVQQVDVTVTEGRVALNDWRPLNSQPVVSAGQQAVIAPAGAASESRPAPIGVRALSASEMQAALAWRMGQVKFSHTPLGEAVKVFNRTAHDVISIPDPAVARLPLSGTLEVGQRDAFVRLLEKGFALEAVPNASGVELRRSPNR